MPIFTMSGFENFVSVNFNFRKIILVLCSKSGQRERWYGVEMRVISVMYVKVLK